MTTYELTYTHPYKPSGSSLNLVIQNAISQAKMLERHGFDVKVTNLENQEVVWPVENKQVII